MDTEHPAEAASSALAEVEHWAYEVESPFRPRHELEALNSDAEAAFQPESFAPAEGFSGEDQLVFEEPEFEAAAYEQPAYEQPVYEPPVHEQPVDELGLESLGEFEIGELEEPEFEEEADPGVALRTLDELLTLETGAGSSLTDRLRAVAAFTLGPTLRRGDKGPAVAALQRALASLGADLAVDGDFGPNTERVVRAFQARSSLTADGVVGPQTKTAIATALAGGGTGPSPTPIPVPVPAVPAATSAWASVPMDTRILRVMELLVNTYAYPVNGAAGLVGNLIAESGVLPDRIEGSTSRTPMRTRNFAGQLVDFTPAEVMNRNFATRTGPRLPGIGLAQWTTSNRRAGLFAHAFQGRVLGTAILSDLDAQVDYLVAELRGPYRSVDAVLRAPAVSVDEAADDVVYRFEIPGAIIGPDRKKLPRSDGRVRAVFTERRRLAHQAIQRYRAAHP
jgi:peptidoglycan hydrolase-like protein with peptidoglycan-binding domain